MQFAAPQAFFWFLLAIPLIALFWLRVRPRRRSVSTVLFWQMAIPESRPRHWWRRMRDPLLLLFQLVLLTLLVWALAEPIWPGAARPPRATVLVLDNSASMQARDGTRTRLERAKRQAAAMMEGLGPQDRIALVSAATTPRILRGLMAPSREVQAALAEIQAVDGPADLPAALDLAQRLLSAEANRDLIVLTDGPGRAQVDDHGEGSVTWLSVGSAVDNTAITQFQVRRQVNDPVGFELLVGVEHFGQEPRDTTLELRLNGKLLDVIPLRLEAQSAWRETRTYLSDFGGTLDATVTGSDGLACDDRAVAIIAARPRLAVLLVTRGSFYLEQVLRALPQVELRVVDQLPAEIPPDTFVIMHRVPVNRLPSRKSLIVDPRPPFVLADLGSPVGDPLITWQAAQSPLLTHVRLQDCVAAGAKQVAWKQDVEVLATTRDQEPVYARVTHADSQSLVLNLSLEDSDLAWRTAFPLLMSNAVQWFSGQSGDYEPAYAGGALVTLAADKLTRLAPSANRLTPSNGPAAGLAAERDEPDRADLTSGYSLTTPRGQRRRILGGPQGVTLGPLDQVGIWSLESASDEIGTAPGAAESANPRSGAAIQLACNLLNREESDLGGAAGVEDSLVAMRTGGFPPWFVSVLLALLVAAVEWWLFQRRWIG